MKLSRKSSILGAGLLAGVSACAVFQVLANAEAAQRLEGMLKRTPGLHIGSVSVNPWSGRITLADLSGAAEGARFTARRIVLHSRRAQPLALVTPAFAAGGEASADDINIDIGVAKVHIPHIEASGGSLSDEDLRQIVDPSSALSPTERMDKLTADEISIPEVSTDVAAGEVTEKLLFKDIKLTDVSRGKIGDFVSGGATMSVSAPNLPGPASGTLGAVTAKNLDLGLYAKLFTQARTDPDEPLQTLYDNTSVDGMQFKVGDAFSFSMGKLTGSGVKVRPLLISIQDLQNQLPKTPGEKPSPEQTKKLLAFLSDMYASMEVGAFDMHDLAIKSESDGKPVSIGLSRVGLSGIANAKFGETAIEGFDVTGPDMHVRLGSFAIRGFNFKPTLDALKLVSPDDWNEPNAMKNVNPRTLIPTIDQVVIANLDADVPDQKHQGNVADGARDKFHIGKVEYDGSNFLLGIPTALSFAIDHAMADLPTNDDNAKQLVALGYTSVDLSGKFDVAWNEQANEMKLKELSLTGAGMGAIKLSGILGNVTKDLFTGDTAVAQAAALAAVIKETSIRIENSGLFEKGLTYAAQASGKTPDQLRSEYITAAAVGIPQALGNVEWAKSVADAVTKFIAQPKSLEIVATAPDGIGAADLSALNDPAKFFSKITVTATANQ